MVENDSDNKRSRNKGSRDTERNGAGRMASVADGFTVEEMTALDAELAKKREKETKELRNQRAKAFEDRLKNNHDNKLRVLVKIAPVGLCEPQQGEQLAFSITTDRGIDVAGFKRAVAEKMKCQPAAFDLLCNETVMREEEGMAEALEGSSIGAPKGKKMRWPKGYAGLVWITPA